MSTMGLQTQGDCQDLGQLVPEPDGRDGVLERDGAEAW